MKKELMLNAGCSALAWETNDNKHLWGRNFDYNRIAEGTFITYFPKNNPYYTDGSSVEQNINEETKRTSKYSCLGMGTMVMGETSPVFYDGVNEVGLTCGVLAMRNFAEYPEKAQEGTQPVGPTYVVSHILMQFETVDEVIDALNNDFTITAIPVFGAIADNHWFVTDKQGHTLIIESTADGLKLHKDSIGILTNSPSYDWQVTNLANYVNLRNKDYDTVAFNGVDIPQSFSGNGLSGLPGDSSAPSRFVRLAFMKKYALQGDHEEDGVVKMLRLLNNVAFPLGLVEVTQGAASKLDADVTDYDCSLYTAIMCNESLKYYWVSYNNLTLQCLDLNKLLSETSPKSFPIETTPDIKYMN